MKNKQPKPLLKTIQLRRRSHNLDPKMKQLSQENKENKSINKFKQTQFESSFKKKKKTFPSISINPSLNPLTASLVMHSHSTSTTPAHRHVSDKSHKQKEILQRVEYWSHRLHITEAKFEIDSLVSQSKSLFQFNQQAYELLCSLKALAFVAIDQSKDKIMSRDEEQDAYIVQPQHSTQMNWLKPAVRQKLKLNLSNVDVIRKRQMIK